MSKFDVTIDRHKYLGGSDISAIMGINPFKTRFQLLLEKAQLVEINFEGNEFTKYGQILEPKIRNFINESGVYSKPFEETQIIDGDCRYNSDGFNGSTVLEIKTTSQIHNDVDDYKHYLAQLVFGMKMHGVEKGLLAVYHRPDDFNETFDKTRLSTYAIDICNYTQFLEKIERAIEQFRLDLAKVKANPFITEEELLPVDLTEISNKVIALEKQLSSYKEIEKEYKDLKQKLFDAMEENNIKKWTTNGNFQITKVDRKPDVEIQESFFNEEKFKAEHSELYDKYLETRIKIQKGKTGYCLITPPKDVA